MGLGLGLGLGLGFELDAHVAAVAQLLERLELLSCGELRLHPRVVTKPEAAAAAAASVSGRSVGLVA